MNTTTKTRIATTLSALVLAGAALTACAPPDPPTLSPQEKEALFLELVRDNTTNRSTDRELIELAGAACDAMKSGATISDLGDAVAGNGLTAKQRTDVSRIIGYGLSQYCPEYGGQR